MKILIVGNMGYVGPLVVRRLREERPGAYLAGLDTGYFAHCLSRHEILPETLLDRQVYADVRAITVDQVRGFDTVIYLAAISNDAMGAIDPSVTMDVNYRMAVKTARLAKRAGVKSFVFASSCSAYGYAEEGARSESSPVNPLTAYAKSKVKAEVALKPLADRRFKVTCFRFATACGMSDRLRLDLVLNDFVAGAMATKKITVLSDGSPWRPLIHVKDMARAIDWGVGRKFSDGGAFLLANAGSDRWNYRVRDFAQAVAKRISGTKVSINTNASPDKRSYRVDFRFFKTLAGGYTPKVSLNEAIDDLAAGLKAMAFNDPDFRSSDYMRLRVLMKHRDAGRLTKNMKWTRG